ncbi:MAG: hypothetical protein HPY60_05150 [Candidatus Methanofastidiosum sp.]|nr:hypothetical protein [Methanofastidiosum sp.]NYT04682.1 hypothetical protein [Candidatus Methanofastidiosa archaeon]NYT13093.1 hypothetical protein [Candidatus Methanofastidiosa archaeon]
MKPDHFEFKSNKPGVFSDIYSVKSLGNYAKFELELRDKEGNLIKEGELHVQVLSELFVPLIVKRFNPFEGKLSLTIGNEHIGLCEAFFLIRFKSDEIIDVSKSKMDIDFVNDI